MSTQEFYIRQPSENEARGPYTLEQMTSLAENNEVAPETLYYEAMTEQWTAIQDNAALMESLFPQKKVLRIKKKEKIQSLNTADEVTKPITVQQMLAAAEGRTEENATVRVPQEVIFRRAVMVGRIGALAILAVTALGFTFYSGAAALRGDLAGMSAKPLSFFGIVDLVLAILVACRLNIAHNLVRIRASLFLGFAGFLYYAMEGAGGILTIGAAAVSAISLFLVVTRQSIMGNLVTGIIGLVATILLVVQIFR
ncbi:DUF4339 domain-containing protein [Opitutaceae bacterium TAV4]|nr:DUF4339 domain-containing protein [Opitutaceae bacterium TAV4]RRK00213.1 DUF4339 domain-containing protein [Opitutaceae bacterium TAV3]